MTNEPVRTATTESAIPGGRTQDAIDVLMDMHREMRTRLEEIMQEQNPQTAMARWTELVTMLHTHEQMEENYLYRPLAEAGEDDARLARYEEEHVSDIEMVEAMLAEIDGVDAGEPAWRTQVGRVRDMLLEHMDEEEADVFPEIREAWDPSKLEQVARQMQELRRERLGAA